MKVSFFPGALAEVKAEVLIVGVFEDTPTLIGEAEELDALCGSIISTRLAEGEFTGKLNQTMALYPSGLAARKLVLVGLGPKDKLDVEKVRQASGNAMKLAVLGKAKSVATAIHGRGVEPLCMEALATAVTEGALLAIYSYDALKSKKDERHLVEFLVVDHCLCHANTLERAVQRGEILAEVTNLARDLVNAPANHMTPTHMAEVAMRIAQDTNLKCEVLERTDMENLKMGALLGVAQGSAQPPKLIVMHYQGDPGGEITAFVGKGLTFDSGGISIKPSDGMHLMKDDMAGGAAVLGVMLAIGRLKPTCNVLGIVAATENMPSGNALKPGDVITAMNGKTIEIISTDAEGRLILADAVAYAVTLGASKVVDVATLTGACGVALGSFYSAIVANNDKLVDEIKQAAAKSGERFWQMPSDADYKELIKSPVADIKNSGGRLGGVMTGGLFIGEFVGETPWAHLDIASAAYAESEKHYQPKGATGVATRTLVAMVCK